MARRGSSSAAAEPEEVEAAVDDYPARPYAEVVTEEQREALAVYGIEVPEAAAVSESSEE